MIVGLAGIHPYDRKVTQEKKDRLAKRMGISSKESLELSHKYVQALELRRGNEPDKHVQAKYQPLQLRWYSSGGRIQWLIPNCDVGGFPNLQWNHFGLPDTLFAPNSSRRYADSAWTVHDDMNFMSSRDGEDPMKLNESDAFLFVYWTYFMGRQSVRLAKYVEKWRKRDGRNISVRYVNADSLMIGIDKPEVLE